MAVGRLRVGVAGQPISVLLLNELQTLGGHLRRSHVWNDGLVVARHGLPQTASLLVLRDSLVRAAQAAIRAPTAVPSQRGAPSGQHGAAHPPR
eukprot:1707815-Pyramimonas_sp.AAC.1